MIKRALSCAFLGLVAATASLSSADSAHAYPYGAFVVHNPTSMTINYQMKWGPNASWQNFEVAPHSWRSHWIELGDDQLVPIPYVRFDYILNDGQVTYRSYEVDVYGTYDRNDGKDYTFQYTGGGQYINLFED